MLYVAAAIASYVIAFVWVRSVIRAEKRNMEEKLLKHSQRDGELVREIIGDADRLIYTIGPSFLVGTLLFAGLSAVIWYVFDSHAWNQ